VSPEIGEMHHIVGIEDTHYRQSFEVESLGDHLCPDKDIGFACGEAAQYIGGSAPVPDSVLIHSRNARRREQQSYLLFDSFSAEAHGGDIH